MFGRVAISLRTFTLLKGLPVYDKETGNVIGHVSDLCFTSLGKVKALLMKGKGLLRRDRLIPINCVTAFGNDGILVQNLQNFKPVRHEQKTHFLQSHHGLFKKPVLSTEGEKLGLLEDVYFLEELGTIIGYELTDGFFADITEGKKVIKTHSPLTVGKDAIVVDVNP